MVLVAGGSGRAQLSLCRSRSRSCVLLAVVGISYRQTIKAYPHGGGSYIVTKDNLGRVAGARRRRRRS